MAILFLKEVKLTYVFNLQAPTDCLLRILMEIADTVLEVIIQDFVDQILNFLVCL